MAIFKLALSRLSLRKSNPTRAMVIVMVLFLGLPGGMIAGTSSIKDEIENGPNRALTLMSPDTWVLQKGSSNVITSSFVSRDVVNKLNDIDGIRAAGVVRDFRAVTSGGSSREAIIYSYRKEIPQMRPPLIEGAQASSDGVVLDTTLAKALGVGPGDRVDIAGLELRIDGITSGTSAIGKEGVFMSERVIDKIVPASDYTAILVTMESGAKLPSWVSDEYSVYTNAEFLQLNSEYWKVNASGLAVTLIQSSTAFGAIILGVSLLVYLFTGRRQLALLRAIGATVKQVWLSELIYLLVVVVASIVIQALVASQVVGMANKSTPGFMGELTLHNVASGFLTVLGAALVIGGLLVYVYIKRGLRDPMGVLASTR